MRNLRLVEGFNYWDTHIPSRSFLKKLSEALTIQIADLLKSDDYKKNLADALELSFLLKIILYITWMIPIK